MNPDPHVSTDTGGALSRRLHLLDELRGLTLVEMILYHFLWDLVYIAGIPIPWYHGTAAHIWQQSICWTFIFLSGFCWSFGRHPFARGITVFLSGGLITLVTLIFLPDDRVIFGVLTLIGSSMLLMIPLDRLLAGIRRPLALNALTALSGLLFLLFLPAAGGYLTNFAALWDKDPLGKTAIRLPGSLYHGWLSAYLGFPAPDFYSTDYFPLLPWFFLFVTGYLTHKICSGANPGRTNLLTLSFWRRNPLPRAAWIGRHSLLIYLLHQPVLYVITLCIIYIRQ